ncbi:MAG TPA: response regulator, partial [Flavipsychrobacter sp.]|nr:response regulator [Flavipsychrobacter sp.]
FLGGNIALSSVPGEGSEFVLTIPIAYQATPEPTIELAIPNTIPEASSAPTPRPYIATLVPEPVSDDRNTLTQNDKSLLIVEDDTGFAKALLELARKNGYKGIVAVRGDEGIELAKQLLPTGILLDVQLPVKSGWEVMEELKNDPLTRHIPVHIMSSYTLKRESLLKGAVDFINKPVAFEKMQEIFDKIEHVLQKENKKVLIIEENPKHARALAYFLATYDVHTEISGSINEGVSALGKDEVDCVILDMGIPDANGYEALERIKENPGLESLPIIVFTGKSLSKSEEERLRQYADTIVVKTAQSYRRILDEVSLFLHLVEAQKKQQRPKGNSLPGTLSEVLRNKTVLVTDDDVRNIFSL